MYRLLTWAVGVLALATVLGAIGYDMTMERIAQAHAAATVDQEAPARPAGEISNEGVERLVVIPLQPASDASRPLHDGPDGPVLERTRQELGSAVKLTAVKPAGDGGTAGAAYVDVPAPVARALAGGLARITLWARADRDDPTDEFALALTEGERFSGWLRFAVGTVNYESFSFVLPIAADGGDKPLRVWIAPDSRSGHGALSASHVIIDRILKPGEPEPAPEAPAAPSPAQQ